MHDPGVVLAQDTADTELLLLFAHAPRLYNSRVPLILLSDINAFKARAGGNGVKIAEMLRAMLVGMPYGQTNEAMSKKTIDKAQFASDSVKVLRQNEVSTRHPAIPGFPHAGIFRMTMTPRTRDKRNDAQMGAVLSIPIFVAIVTSMGFDPVWLGALVVLVVELALIAPPLGINVFIIRGQVPHVPRSRIIASVLPFCIALVGLNARRI